MTSVVIVKPIPITADKVLFTNVVTDDYPAFDLGVTYAAGDRSIVGNEIYESVADDNTGHEPTAAESADLWLRYGMVNPYRVFDISNSTTSARAGGAMWRIKPNRPVRYVYASDISNAVSMRVTMTDPSYVDPVFSKTVSLMPRPYEKSFAGWFRGERRRLSKAPLIQVPNYPRATFEVEFIGSSQFDIGTLVLGSGTRIGIGASWGITVDFKDASGWTKNKWAQTQYIEAEKSDEVEFEVIVKTKDLDAAYDYLRSIGSTPCVFVATSLFNITAPYGTLIGLKAGVDNAIQTPLQLTVQKAP